MSQAKILVVEDQDQLATYIKFSLKSFGYDVPETASTGEQAVTLADEIKPDLILMDIILSGDIDGIEASKRIRAQNDIPIIYLTGHNDKSIIEKARTTHPYGFLIKPFKKAELQTTIEIALYKHKAELNIRESEKWLNTTINGISKAVIVTNNQGIIEHTNPIADYLTGWKQYEAKGKHITEVLKLIDADEQTPIDNPVLQAIETEEVVESTTQHLLVSKNQTKTPIYHYVRPNKDISGKTCGALLVLEQEITKESANGSAGKETTIPTSSDTTEVWQNDHADKVIDIGKHSSPTADAAPPQHDEERSIAEEKYKQEITDLLEANRSLKEKNDELFKQVDQQKEELAIITKDLQTEASTRKSVEDKLENLNDQTDNIIKEKTIQLFRANIELQEEIENLKKGNTEQQNDVSDDTSKLSEPATTVDPEKLSELVQKNKNLLIENQKLQSLHSENKNIIDAYEKNFQELIKKNKYDEITSSIYKTIYETKSTEKLIEKTAELIITNMDCVDHTTIYLVDDTTAKLKASEGLPEQDLSKLEFIERPISHIWKAILAKESIHCENLSEEDPLEPYSPNAGIKSYVTTPIKNETEVIGCINIYSIQDGNNFEEDEKNLLDIIAQQLGMTLSNTEISGELKKSEERYRILFDKAPIGVFIYDSDHKITHCNEKMANMLSSVCDNAYGFNLKTLRNDQLTSAMDSVFLGEPAKTEFLFDGNTESRETWLSVSLSPLTQSNDRSSFGMGVAEDITDQKNSEAVLIEEKEMLDATLRSIGDGVFVTDTEGHVISMNKISEEFSGWTQEEAIGKKLSEIFVLVNKESRKVCESPIDRALEQNDSVGLVKDTVLLSRDGTEKFLSASCSPVRNKDQITVGTILVFREITNIKKRDEELLKAQKLESVSALASGVAHDLNNILTGIMGNLTLSKVYVQEDEVTYSRIVESEKACYQAADLAKRLISFANIESPTKKVMSDVAELITSAAELATKGSNVMCEFSIPEDLWSIEADEKQINQVIYNLVQNAKQAMPAGGIVYVSVENEEIQDGTSRNLADRKYIKIEVADTGEGIPKEQIENIFDPYFSTSSKRTGLGLTTSFTIVKNHDGKIEVDSKLGEGSVFKVYLPADDEVVVLTEETTETDVDIITQSSFRGRILLMDDDAVVRETAGETLELMGYEVEFAKDGIEAIDMYDKAYKDENLYDVVILDLTVSGGAGAKDAIDKILEIDPEAKALVSSGYTEDPVITNFADYGFKGYISKPYSIEELSDIVKTAINSGDSSSSVNTEAFQFNQ